MDLKIVILKYSFNENSSNTTRFKVIYLQHIKYRFKNFLYIFTLVLYSVKGFEMSESSFKIKAFIKKGKKNNK